MEPATCDACGGVLLVKKDPIGGRAWWTCSGCRSEFEVGLGPLRVLYPELAARREAAASKDQQSPTDGGSA